MKKHRHVTQTNVVMATNISHVFNKITYYPYVSFLNNEINLIGNWVLFR